MNEADRLMTLARHVASMVEAGAIVGLGSGSTAEAFVAALGERVASGLRVRGVPTSERTREKALAVGIELVTLSACEQLDIGVDGADEIDPHLNLVKGRGGALLYEKIVAGACRTWGIVASGEKLVDRLGSRIALPVEVVPFGWERTADAISMCGLFPQLRQTATGEPFVTDGGHFILDCATSPLDDPAGLAETLKGMTGVVDHGLFIGLADFAVTIDADGHLTTHERPGS